MLKTLDILIGLSVIMLLLSMIVTVITQFVITILNSRGKHLLHGIADMLEQIDPSVTREAAEKIASAVLSHPLVQGANGRPGGVIHREELTKLLLELASGEGPQQLAPETMKALQDALVANGVCDGGSPDQIKQQLTVTINNIRSTALQLELAHPELTNAARVRIAMLQKASSQFLGKINLWFDQTMDRVSDRFTQHTRYVTFITGLLIALAIQLDTAALVSRLSTDNALRSALVTQAQSEVAQGDATRGDGNPGVRLTPTDVQNVRDLMTNNLLGVPQSFSDWRGRWTWDRAGMKVLGILLSALLLSLGAPFWYNALQNLIRLRSVVATKDDQQRLERQGSGSKAGVGAASAPASNESPAVVS